MPKNKTDAKNAKLVDISKYFILISLVLLLFGIVWIISPFIPSVIIGGVISVSFYPVHKKIRKIFWEKRTLATIISTLIILTIILLPLSWFASYLTGQALDTYSYVGSKVSSLLKIDINLIPNILRESFAGKYFMKAETIFTITSEDVIGFATTIIQNVSQFLVNQTTSFAKQISVLAIHLFVLVISIIFFLRDGDLFIKEIKKLLPLAEKYKNIVFEKLQNMSEGILYGIFGAAISQGVLGGIGFALVGIKNAAFWGTIMAFFAIIPYIGCTIIWIPAAVILLITGHWVAAVFIVLWGVFAVGTIDNFIKPLVIGEKAHIHPLLSFLAILGGIFTMGLPGLIIAPYILSLALTFIHIYKLEYKNVLMR